MNKKSIVLISVVLMLFAACAGDAGPQGEAGAQGEQGPAGEVSDAQVAAAVEAALAEEEAEVGGTLVIYLSLIHISEPTRPY